MLGVVKRNPLFLHEIEWKNNGFLFTTSNIYKNKIISKKKLAAFSWFGTINQTFEIISIH